VRALVAAVENEHEGDGVRNRYQQVLLWQVELGSAGAPEEVTAGGARDPGAGSAGGPARRSRTAGTITRPGGGREGVAA
jgi:hypothetical protein